MTTDSHAGPAACHRVHGPRDYILPDTVQANITPRHYDGEPELWAYARRLLIETCLALPWTPLGLFVGVETNEHDHTTAMVLTIIGKDETTERKTDRQADLVTVVWRQDHNSGVPGQRVWRLTINGAPHHTPGSRRVRPSPPILAGIIREAVNG